MANAVAVELHMGTADAGTARLEIVSEDDRGDRFVTDLVGPEADIRAEATFLAEQYHLAVA